MRVKGKGMTTKTMTLDGWMAEVAALAGVQVSELPVWFQYCGCWSAGIPAAEVAGWAKREIKRVSDNDRPLPGPRGRIGRG